MEHYLSLVSLASHYTALLQFECFLCTPTLKVALVHASSGLQKKREDKNDANASNVIIFSVRNSEWGYDAYNDGTCS